MNHYDLEKGGSSSSTSNSIYHRNNNNNNNHITPSDSTPFSIKEKHQDTNFIQDDDELFLREEDEESDVDGSVNEIKRGLKARHVSMIALGGTIGTGLFISTGSTLADAGPVLALISFLFMTTIAFSVTQSLGEMATLIPVSGSFAQFVTRWISKSAGAANGWLYWFSWAITFALELSVVGQVIEYWTDAVPLAAWISIFFVIITIFNFFPVKFYGEVEFWVASIKVIAVFGWIIYALCTGEMVMLGVMGFWFLIREQRDFLVSYRH